MTESRDKFNGSERRLNVVDTENVLTTDELHELKRLASASKAARMLLVILIGIVSLVGADKIIEFISKNH